MSMTPDAERTLAAAVASWFRDFTGMSALDCARQLDLDHSIVMRLFEQLASDGYGSLNKDVTLVQLSFDPKNFAAGFNQSPIETHIFFPSKEALRNAYFSSDLPQQRLPEYTTRLHLGAHQLGLVYFGEEVLSRYLDHPEHYEIHDSLTGGDVSTNSTAPQDRHLYVRYGKVALSPGGVAVTAIYKDLSDMSPAEQRYWHSFELEGAKIDKSDSHFKKFLARTYEGDWVDFDDPISRLLGAVETANAAVIPCVLFSKTENVHLRLPVEQTFKSHCDASSELYKVVGPDSMSVAGLKQLLTTHFGLIPNDFQHDDSGRAKSPVQLFELLEQKLGKPGLFTSLVRKLADLRVSADHKVLKPDIESKSYSREFASICDGLAVALEKMAAGIENHRKS